MKKLLLLCLAASAALAEAPSAFAIRGARVVTVSGPVIEKGVVLIRDGLIQDVGTGLTIPPDAWVIEGEGLTVYPGLIDALSPIGFKKPEESKPPAQPAPPPRGPEDRPATTSWLRAADQIDPADKRIESARNAGFTAAAVFPESGIFAGQGAVIALAGERPGDMVISAPAAMRLALPEGAFAVYPGSLMGVMAYIRQVYLDAAHYKLARERYAKQPAGVKRPAYDRALEGALETQRILLPAVSAVEIERMVKFSSGLQVPAALYGAHGAYRETDLLRQTGAAALVSLKWPERKKEEDPEVEDSLRTLEFRDQAPSTPAALARAGCRFAFYTDGAPLKDLNKAVKRAFDAGLSQADAVRAFTLSAAEIYGLADRLGSVDKGKIANLVITDGDLFAEKTKVKTVFIDGRKFTPPPEPPEDKDKKEDAR